MVDVPLRVLSVVNLTSGLTCEKNHDYFRFVKK